MRHAHALFLLAGLAGCDLTDAGTYEYTVAADEFARWGERRVHVHPLRERLAEPPKVGDEAQRIDYAVTQAGLHVTTDRAWEFDLTTIAEQARPGQPVSLTISAADPHDASLGIYWRRKIPGIDTPNFESAMIAMLEHERALSRQPSYDVEHPDKFALNSMTFTITALDVGPNRDPALARRHYTATLSQWVEQGYADGSEPKIHNQPLPLGSWLPPDQLTLSLFVVALPIPGLDTVERLSHQIQYQVTEGAPITAAPAPAPTTPAPTTPTPTVDTAPDTTDDGGGCANSGGSPALLWLLALALIRRRL